MNYKKISFALFITCGLLFGFLAFKPAAAQYSGRKVTLTFYHVMQYDKGKTLKELLRRFETENPGIKVVDKAIESKAIHLGNNYHALYNEIMEQLAQKTPPNVAMAFENWIAGWVEVGAILNLDDLQNLSGGLSLKELEDFIPIFRQANSFGGKLYGLPFNKSIYLLFYNKQALAEKGLNPPQTWEELREVAKKLTITKNGEVVRYGIAVEPSVDVFGHWLYTYGGDFLDLKENKVAFDSQLGLKDMNYWYNLVHKDGSAVFSFDPVKEFIAGRSALNILTTSRIPTLEKSVTFPLGVSMVPIGTDRKYQFGGTNLVIFKNPDPRVQEAAWKLVKFLTSTEINTYWALRTGYLPVRYSAISSPEYQAYLKANPDYQEGIKALKFAKVQPKVPAWETIRRIIDDEMYRMLTRKASPSEALNAAAERANTLLKGLGRKDLMGEK